MILFLDTEFTDFLDCQLLSLGAISQDGQHSLYIEVADFDRAKCSAFVWEAVLPQLGRVPEAITRKDQVRERLLAFFASLPRSVQIAVDSQYDCNLLYDSLDGKWPPNLDGWIDLNAINDLEAFRLGVARFRRKTGKPLHHALFDAEAHRAGWLSWNDRRARRVW
ncbi:hypothetical protein LH450_03675 [Laribacter hongkongensis]|uniref:hypothetical protein n=1 Tax=Laribacter hongkongensis TaxID=168471 RepID=UPI001EFC6ADB|nr:hypothetical protein [Laribacter hongkongensis]MCG9000260.1 hypothetical protein [Laribacter hongkongensis]MCG9006650.1 hypothetical protein [Laribacter hongkongensis]MCG9015680.1 hypothetical protein [Laribacter hongkongensis]